MTIHRIKHLNAIMAAELAVLAAKIPDLALDNYIQYLYEYLPSSDMAVYGLFDDAGDLVGFAHAEAPHPVWPTEGYLLMSAAKPGLPLKARRSVLEAVENWLRSKGATTLRITTNRSARAFNRLYGVYPTHDQILEKSL